MEFVFLLLSLLGFAGIIIAFIKPDPIMKLLRVKKRWHALLACFNIGVFSLLIFVFMVAPPEIEERNEVASTGQTVESNNSGPNLEWKTKEGHYLASLSKDLLDKAVDYAVNNDLQALDQMIKAELVFPLKSGMTVTLEDASVFGGYVKIRPKGANFSLFTVREAITQ